MSKEIKITVPIFDEEEKRKLENMTLNEVQPAIDEFTKRSIKDKDLAVAQIVIKKQQQEINNIKNILKELDRLQKENEELKEKIMENDLKVIGIEEYTKASMGEIIEEYYTANEDCIPKSVIQDKIEEIINNSTFGCVGCEWNDIEVVQLLENILRGNN